MTRLRAVAALCVGAAVILAPSPRGHDELLYVDGRATSWSMTCNVTVDSSVRLTVKHTIVSSGALWTINGKPCALIEAHISR